MWSGPRNHSTAMMYSFGNRSDCSVLTAGLPMATLAQLMGHSSETMIRKHYSKWIADDSNGRVGRLMDTLIETLG